MGDENKSDDMAKFIRAADTVRTAFNCLMLLIHHCGIAGNRPRGHTSLAGADDVQIAGRAILHVLDRGAHDAFEQPP